MITTATEGPTPAQREAAQARLMEAWHAYLATLPPAERLARLA